METEFYSAQNARDQYRGEPGSDAGHPSPARIGHSKSPDKVVSPGGADSELPAWIQYWPV